MCVKIIAREEIKQITRASIHHFAIPIIAGFSLDTVSQEEYEAMGGIGKKPEVEPLSSEIKLAIYRRIKKFYKEKILVEITKLVMSVLDQSLKSFSDDDLKVKVAAIKQKVAVKEPNWEKFSELFENHLCLFEDLNKSTHLNVDLRIFHDEICPLMSEYRDSGELFDKIHVDDFF